MEEDADCAKFQIPTRLHRLTRFAVREFQDLEKLYRRVDPKQIEDEGLAIASVRFRGGMSVNRDGLDSNRISLYPEDVLFDTRSENHYSGWSILVFNVEAIRRFTWEHPDTGKRYELRLKHEPEQCMFPHSLVELFCEGERKESVQSKKHSLELKDRVAAMGELKPKCSVPSD
jgi:hypothetical protein